MSAFFVVAALAMRIANAGLTCILDGVFYTRIRLLRWTEEWFDHRWAAWKTNFEEI
jgi:hypothetical protein